MKKRLQYRNPDLNYYRTNIRARALQLLNTARHRAKRKGLEFDLTVEWFMDKLATGTCEKTGFPFAYEAVPNRRVNPYAPSLDRRDNAIGYTKANTQVVLVAINLAKNEFSETEFLDVMRAYVARNDNSCV